MQIKGHIVRKSGSFQTLGTFSLSIDVFLVISARERSARFHRVRSARWVIRQAVKPDAGSASNRNGFINVRFTSEILVASRLLQSLTLVASGQSGQRPSSRCSADRCCCFVGHIPMGNGHLTRIYVRQ